MLSFAIAYQVSHLKKNKKSKKGKNGRGKKEVKKGHPFSVDY